MARTVQVDEDQFIGMLWDRVKDFRPAEDYTDDFWAEVFAYLQDTGWLDAKKMNPLYIIDNIAVNGDICEYKDCIDNYDDINKKYDGNVDEWIEDKGYLMFDKYVVLNLGLD